MTGNVIEGQAVMEHDARQVSRGAAQIVVAQ